MKNLLFTLSFSIFYATLCLAQGSYYNGVDFTLDELELKDELANHIIATHTNTLVYSEVWNVLKQSDLEPGNINDVLLIYGYNDNDSDITNDRTRDKDDNGGNVGDWNREHVYPRSLGTPNLGDTGPGADPHHLRSSDVQMNGNRGNSKYASGSGNAGNSSGGWYPGNEWKGDCARMIMYMYLRYGNQCLPSNVGIGSTNSIDSDMINLFLQWNAEDPVSEYELVRNDVVEEAQGNRNPFIDNPALATKIWGGTPADDPWGILTAIDELDQVQLKLFPNPSSDVINLQLENPELIDNVSIFDAKGQLVLVSSFRPMFDISFLPAGNYQLQINGDGIRSVETFVKE